MSDLNLHETEWIKSHLKKSDVCIDIGANVGYFTVLMAKQCKLVYSFEPDDDNFTLLSKNVAENRINNVSLHKAAVSEWTGNEFLYHCDIDSGMHRIYASKWCNGKKSEVESFSIDDLIIGRVEFVKMDIEGSELGALRGMKRLLEKCKPTIMMEFYCPAIQEYGANPKDVYDFLVNLGYSIRLFPDTETPISYDDLVARTSADNQAGQNVLCKML